MRSARTGGARVGCSPTNTRVVTRPLFKLPSGDVGFVLWLISRSVSFNDTAGYAAMTETSHGILSRMQAIGGKAYPPFAPYFSQPEWQNHYGSRDVAPACRC